MGSEMCIRDSGSSADESVGAILRLFYDVIGVDLHSTGIPWHGLWSTGMSVRVETTSCTKGSLVFSVNNLYQVRATV